MGSREGRKNNLGSRAKALQHHSVTCGYSFCPVVPFWESMGIHFRGLSEGTGA